MNSWHSSCVRWTYLLCELKQWLLGEVLEVAAEPRSTRRPRLAASARRPFALLVSPCLFEEMARS